MRSPPGRTVLRLPVIVLALVLATILAFALIAVPERFAALLAGFGNLPFGLWPA